MVRKKQDLCYECLNVFACLCVFPSARNTSSRLSMNVVLYQPEIPPNTGSVGRLCAAVEIPLHLVRPLGFELDDKHLKRAGLDYWPHVDLHVYASWAEFLSRHGNQRLLYFSKKASQIYTQARFTCRDFLVFGPETRGLPEPLLHANAPNTYRIPMKSRHVRSLNLANAVSIIVYEGLRQIGELSGGAK